MSDYQVDGWWQASDGKWYPPPTGTALATSEQSVGLYSGGGAPSNGYYQQPSVPQYGISNGQVQPTVVVANGSKSPGLAVASLVLGIGAMFFAFLPFIGFASIPFACIGLALGLAGYARSRKGFEGKGLSIAGSVTSILALLISVAWFAFFGRATNAINKNYGVAPSTAFALSPLSCGSEGTSKVAYTGSFTNKTSERRDFAITVRFRSSDGATTTDRTNTGPLDPGAVVPVKATAYFFEGSGSITCAIEGVRYDGI